jgi:hypothetical protein
MVGTESLYKRARGEGTAIRRAWLDEARHRQGKQGSGEWGWRSGVYC